MAAAHTAAVSPWALNGAHTNTKGPEARSLLEACSFMAVHKVTWI